MKLYLFIFEDGTIQVRDSFTDGDAASCEAGILQAIDITECDRPLDYYAGKWTPIQVAKS